MIGVKVYAQNGVVRGAVSEDGSTKPRRSGAVVARVTLKTGLAIFVVLVVAGAKAQTLTVEADQPVYLVGDVITLTVTGDSAGAAATGIWGQLLYPAALTRTMQATQTRHTSNGGSSKWSMAPLPLADGRAAVFNQIAGFSAMTVDQPQIATATLIAEAPGDVSVSFGSGLDFFGASGAGTNFTILPHPTIPPPLPGVPPPPGPSAPFAGGPAGSSNSYVVWPEVAELGETVGILLSGPAAVDLSADAAPVEVDPESFAVSVTHMCGASCSCGGGSSCTENIVPRAAIEAPASLGSVLTGQNAGSWTGVVLLFDLPAAWVHSSLNPSGGYGTESLFIGVSHEGQLLFDGESVLITGNGTRAGSVPLSPQEIEFLRALEQRPMLRLRPSWEPGASPAPEGFDPSWDIRAIEVTLSFTQTMPRGDVINISPLANGDASKALTIVQALAPRQWKVSIFAPDGFSVEHKGCAAAGDCYAGRWTLVDLALEAAEGTAPEVFLASDFMIDDVVVLDANGTRLNPAFSGETYFRLHAVNNLVDLMPPAGSTPVLIWPQRARLGDTVAVLFNSEADVVADPDDAYLDAASGNVVVHVYDPDHPTFAGWSTPPGAVTVIELPAALGSQKVEEVLGAPPLSQTGVIAVFELPETWPNPAPSYPSDPPPDFDIEVKYNGGTTSGTGGVEMLGIGGSATDFTPTTGLEQLARDRLLRLRPLWDGGVQEGFDPAWDIRAIEFELRYQQKPGGLGEVMDLAAIPNGEAVADLAIVDRLPDEGMDKLWGIRLLAPNGFSLLPGSSGTARVGRWSLLDLRVEAQDNGADPDEVFDETEFSVEDVKVFKLDGSTHPYQGPASFELTAVLPEANASLQLLAGFAAVWMLRGCRRRRGEA